MNKRTHLKTASLITASTVFSEFISCTPNPSNVSGTVDSVAKLEPNTAAVEPINWAKNVKYKSKDIIAPKTIEELQALIKSHKKSKPLGTKHCFNTIADCDHIQISSSAFNQVISLDKQNHSITVGAGIRYGEFCEYLDKNGFALFNLASLPHISVGGACATSTHGSGIRNGSLATAVTAFEFVNGKGELVSLSQEKNDEEFCLAVVGLGALGLVTKITLKLQPTFKMKQVVYQNMPMAVLEKNFTEIMSKGYSVSLFTDWTNKNINEVWIKSKSADLQNPSPDFYGAKIAKKNLHPIESADAINCTEQMGEEGTWYERMPHFKMGFTPSSGKELQSEFFIDANQAYAGLVSIEKLNAKISPHLFITEIRTVAADNLPMSPMFNKTCVVFHFTWKQDTEAVMAILPEIEKALEPYNPRPHWGKIFTMEPKVLQSRIEKLNDFKALMAKHDPEGKFRNEFLEKNLFG